MFGGVKFRPDRDMPDLRGKVILVTGGSDGLGKESVRQFASHGATVYIGARNQTKATAAIMELKADLKGEPKSDLLGAEADIRFVELDLASLASVAKAARAFLSQSQRLDILMNNGGIMATPPGLTQDGYEIQFGTNHIGHALLTKLLLPLMETTVGLGDDVRIINVTSVAQEWFGPPKGLLLEGAKTKMEDIGEWQRYGHSKIANVYFTKGLAKRYPSIRCVAVHPGGTKTNLSKGVQPSKPSLFQSAMNVVKKFTFVEVAEGARNQLWASTAAEVRTGVLYYPVAKEHKERAILRDEKIADRLWDWTETELLQFADVKSLEGPSH